MLLKVLLSGETFTTLQAQERSITCMFGDMHIEMISNEDNERGEGLNRSLDGGEHYDDVPYNHRRNLERVFDRNQYVPHPRQKLMYRLAILGIVSRPQAMGTSTTNN